MIVALDLGTKTGWAIRDGESVQSGTASFQPGRYEGGGMRFLRFQRWLRELIPADRKALVFFEEVRSHMGTDAAHIYGGLLGTLTSWCEAHDMPYLGVPVGTIKKAVTGHGGASKEQVIAAIRAMGYRPCDDNEADALALLHWVKTEGER